MVPAGACGFHAWCRVPVNKVAAGLGPAGLLRSCPNVAHLLGVLETSTDPTPLNIAVSIFEILPYYVNWCYFRERQIKK
jgi:hypothetical protein